jgi:phage terminase small subunit
MTQFLGENTAGMNQFKPVPIEIYRQGTAPEAPSSLSELGASLWRQILSERRLTSRAELTILEHACAAHARAESLRQQILTTGDLIETAQIGSFKANPLLVVELQARALCARLLDRLIPAEDKRAPGRPPNQRPSF